MGLSTNFYPVLQGYSTMTKTQANRRKRHLKKLKRATLRHFDVLIGTRIERFPGRIKFLRRRPPHMKDMVKYLFG